MLKMIKKPKKAIRRVEVNPYENPNPKVKKNTGVKTRKITHENEASTAHEGPHVSHTEHRVPQQPKPMEHRPERTTEDEAIRTMQTYGEGCSYSDPEEFAPTKHTSNRIRKRVLNVLPVSGREFDHATNDVMGAVAEVQSDKTMLPMRSEWHHDMDHLQEQLDQKHVQWERPM